MSRQYVSRNGHQSRPVTETLGSRGVRQMPRAVPSRNRNQTRPVRSLARKGIKPLMLGQIIQVVRAVLSRRSWSGDLYPVDTAVVQGNKKTIRVQQTNRSTAPSHTLLSRVASPDTPRLRSSTSRPFELKSGEGPVGLSVSVIILVPKHPSSAIRPGAVRDKYAD